MAKKKQEVVSPETNVDLPEPQVEEVPSPEPLTQTEEENKVLAEAEKGIDLALSEPVLPEIKSSNQPFAIGDVIVVGKTKAIIIDYAKFVGYTYGLVTNNPSNASAFFGFAGKSKLMNLLGITDSALKEKVWLQMREEYAKRK